MRFILFFLFFLTACSSVPARKGVVIAHRGASTYLPEHTLEAYAYAHAFGVDYIEPDIVLTKDNVPICLHDVTLETTTNVEEAYPLKKRDDGHWYAIDFTLKQIKRLSVHERTNKNKPVFKNRFPINVSSFKVPTLDEFVQLINGLNKSADKNIGIYPEIKKPEFHQKNGKDIATIVMSKLRKYGYDKKTNTIFVQSFHPPTLQKLKTKMPLIQLIGENSWGDSSTDFDFLKTDEGLKFIKSYATGIGIWLRHIKKDPTLVTRAKKIGLLVHAYTHRPESSNGDLDYYFNSLQLDGIFSDQPDIE